MQQTLDYKQSTLLALGGVCIVGLLYHQHEYSNSKMLQKSKLLFTKCFNSINNMPSSLRFVTLLFPQMLGLYTAFKSVSIIDRAICTTVISLCHCLVSYGISTFTAIPFKYTILLTYITLPLVEFRTEFGIKSLPSDADPLFNLYRILYWDYAQILALKSVALYSFDKSLNYGLFPPSLNIINEHIALGRLPLAKEIEIMNKSPYNIVMVFNMCRETNGSIDKYNEFGIKQYRFATCDDTPPKDEVVFECIELINKFIKDKENDDTKTRNRVLIHCAFGKGRSATIVLCWLISTGMRIDDAFQYMKKKRVHVSAKILHYPVVSNVKRKYSSGNKN